MSKANQKDNTLGFPHLEQLVEENKYDALNEVFLSSYEKLEGIAKGKGSLPRRKAAKKAMRAFELTMNLLRDFIKVREELMKQSQGHG